MAFAEIGELRVALAANVAAFSRNMREARYSVQSNARGMTDAFKGLEKAYGRIIQSAKVAAASMAAVGAYAIIRGLKESARIFRPRFWSERPVCSCG